MEKEKVIAPGFEFRYDYAYPGKVSLSLGNFALSDDHVGNPLQKLPIDQISDGRLVVEVN